MAAQCHHRSNSKQQPQYLRQVDPAIWKACAGTSVQIPEINSRVYYFPQGHMEYCSPQPAISAFSHLAPRPFVLSRVLQVLYLVDPDTDEVYSRIRLDPRSNGDYYLSQRPLSSPSSVAGFRLPMAEVGHDVVNGRKEEGSVVVSFSKVLTPSDANNGGGFSVPRFCADSIFPLLDFGANPPVQTVTITDLRGESWNFRHIYRGTPRRHLLTTGWSKFVNSKKLMSGDSVVFMKNKITGKLFVGIKRGHKSGPSVDLSRWVQQYGTAQGRMRMEERTGAVGGIMRAAAGEGETEFPTNAKGKVPPESVVEALELAANNMPFEVVYYPKAGSQDFVVAAEKVEQALCICWTAGMRIRMPMETEDSSRLNWLQGTVSSVAVPDHGPWQRSPWRMLQVAWDEPENLKHIKRVSPWQLEYVSPTPPIDTAFPPAKKFRISPNCGFLSDGEPDLPLPPMGFSSSMFGHLSSSYLNYNTFPAGMQGARQDAFCYSSLANFVSNGTRQLCPVYTDNNLVQKAEAVSTDLNIGSSSQSDIVSPNSSSSILSSSPEASELKAASFAPKAAMDTIQLFGNTIPIKSPAESPKHVGSVENVGNKRSMENEGMRNPLDLCLSYPYKKLLDRIDGSCTAAPAVEAYSLSMAR